MKQDILKQLLPLSVLLLLASRTDRLTAQKGVSLGPVRVAVVETVQDGMPPTLRLDIATLREYGCSNYRVNAVSYRHRDTVSVVLRGLLPEELCDDAIGPAHVYVPLPLAPGQYILEVHHPVATDRYRLEMSPARAELRPIGVAQVTRVDSTALWRRPVRSFAVYCGTDLAKKLCADLRDWIERLPGVSPLTFPVGARDPYALPGATDYIDQRYYRYERDMSLAKLRACLGDIARRLTPTVGATIRVVTAASGEIHAFSHRSFHETHEPLPERIPASSGC